jgi:hypothetical protein
MRWNHPVLKWLNRSTRSGESPRTRSYAFSIFGLHLGEASEEGPSSKPTLSSLCLVSLLVAIELARICTVAIEVKSRRLAENTMILGLEA